MEQEVGRVGGVGKEKGVGREGRRKEQEQREITERARKEWE